MVEQETGTLGKALALLDRVAEAEVPPRFTDLLVMSGQPRGTLHRQLSHLVAEDMLELAADGTYRPGIRLLRLAARSWRTSDIRQIAAPHLARLQAETGETVHFGVLRGLEVVYLDKVESRQSVRMVSAIGHSAPAYCTGVGKAALSLLPADRLAECLAGQTLLRHTPNTITDRQALEAELAAIRRAGVAYDREEHEAGIFCMAAPIAGGGPEGCAGLSVTLPLYRLTDAHREAWPARVQAAADALAVDLAARLRPDRP